MCRRLFLLLATILVLSACADGATDPAPPEPQLQAAAQTEPTRPPVSTPNPALPTPPPVSDVELLTGPGAGPPELYNVPAEQSKRELAARLRTTSTQLDRLNPDLPATVPADTLISVPFDYLVQGAETTLQTVAEETGLPRWILERANPGVEPFEPLAAETLLRTPRLFVTYADTNLDAVAQQLDVDRGQMRTFNDPWAADQTIPADTALIIPF